MPLNVLSDVTIFNHRIIRVLLFGRSSLALLQSKQHSEWKAHQYHKSQTLHYSGSGSYSSAIQSCKAGLALSEWGNFRETPCQQLFSRLNLHQLTTGVWPGSFLACWPASSRASPPACSTHWQAVRDAVPWMETNSAGLPGPAAATQSCSL